jgi:hypothetical protein
LPELVPAGLSLQVDSATYDRPISPGQLLFSPVRLSPLVGDNAPGPAAAASEELQDEQLKPDPREILGSLGQSESGSLSVSNPAPSLALSQVKFNLSL